MGADIADSTLIAGRPQYAALATREGEHRFYDTLRTYNGSYVDSSHFFDVSITLYIDTAQVIEEWRQ